MARIGFGAEPEPTTHRPPRDCPVCGDGLSVTRLGCASCGSELSGVFRVCEFCSLSDAERELLHVFLAARGNLRRVERHLGVSYPTARQRFADLLRTLGIQPDTSEEPAEPPPAEPVDRDRVLARLAAGEISVDEAEEMLRASAGRHSAPQ